jgi:hypothetical protein
MSLPAIGDGEQIGDGNTGETLNVGRSSQPLQLQPSSSGTLGFYGKTPAAKGAAVTTLATTPTATDIATAVNSIISRLQTVGLIA